MVCPEKVMLDKANANVILCWELVCS